MATATLIQDRGKRFESRIGAAGGVAQGEKYYRCDTADEAAAFAAVLAVVPIGTAYSVSYPAALSQDYDIVEQFGAWTTYRVGFTTQLSTGTIDAIADTSTKFHEFRPGVGQQEVYADISGNPVPRTTINVAAHELVVTAYRNGTQWNTAFSHWLAITTPKPVRNSNSVVIPNKWDVTGSGFTAAANQLLPLTMEDEPVKTGVIRVRYRFAIGAAGTFAFTYRNIDASGNPTGSPVTRQVYDSASINGSAQLW